MKVKNQEELEQLREKYVGRYATNKRSGEQYLIVAINLVYFRGNRGDYEVAIAIVDPINPDAEQFFPTPPPVNFLLHHFWIAQ